MQTPRGGLIGAILKATWATYLGLPVPVLSSVNIHLIGHDEV